MDSPRFLIKSLSKKSLLIILASVVFLITVLSGVAPSQKEEAGKDETMRQVVQEMIKVGTTQYARGYYAEAEKTFVMAQDYVQYLTAEERNELSGLLEKAQLAARQRKQALEEKQAAGELFAKGELIKAKAHLEKIKDSSFLTEQERAGNLQLLKQIDAQLAKSPVEGIVKTESSLEQAKVGPEKVAKEPNTIDSQLNDRKKKVAETYYRSMQLYRDGQLEKAREGLIEVVKSGLIPPAMVETINGYLAQINGTLGEKTLMEQPKPAVEAPTKLDVNEPKIPEAKTIEPEVAKPEVVEPQPPIKSGAEMAAPEAAKPEVVAPEPAEPVTRAGGYIEEIKNRRNIRRSHARAVVNDAVANAQKHIDKGEFDKAEEAVQKAQRIVFEYQMDLGDEFFKLYSDALLQLNHKITDARGEKIRQSDEQKRTEAIEAQRQFREQMEADRLKRIQTLMENAKAYTKQQRYDAALGQLETLLAIDPQNDAALVLKDALDDMVYLRKQLEVQKEARKQRADILLETDKSAIPYAEELTYPKNWREIIQKPTRQPDKPIGLDPADVAVYEQLDRIVDLSQLTRTMPISEAINILKNSVEPPLKIVVLWRDLLDNAETEPTTPINMDGLPAVRLGTGLQNLLQAVSSGIAELGYVVDNGVITIATVGSLPSKMETRVYDITDLVSQPANFQQMGGMMGMGMMGMGGMGMMGMGMGGYGMGGMGGYGMGGMGGYGGGGYGGYGGGGMGGYGGYGGGGYGGYGGGGYGGYGGGMGGYGGYGGGMGGYGGGMGGYGGGGYGGYGGGGYGGYGGGMGGYGGYGGMGGMGGMGGYGMGGYGMGGMGGYDTSTYRAQDLQYLIQDTIEPDSWYDYGGEGDITVYPAGERPRKMAVLATREVHAEIEKLLKELRKALGYQVSIEARFLVVSENFLEDIGLDIDFVANLGGKWGQIAVEQGSVLSTQTEATKVSGSLGGMSAAGTVRGGYGTILDDLQVSFLLRMTQGRADAQTMTAPKATVLSGESASFSITDQGWFVTPVSTFQTLVPTWPAGAVTNIQPPQPQAFSTGTYLTITPTIMPDKKNVLLNIQAMLNELLRMRTYNSPGVTADGEVYELPYSLPETEISNVMTRVSVPDGGTLLLGGQKISAEVEKEVGVPILSKIPIIGIAFGNRTKIRDHRILLILVRPTIILQEEREAEAIAAMEKEL